MSNSTQYKLLSHEVFPPETSWERIAVELEDVNLSNRISAILADTEITPPVLAWNNIEASLNKEHFTETIALKLNEVEVTPPISAWANIENAINSTKEVAPVIKGKFFPYWKYAAAAVLTGAIAWGSIKLINNKDSESITIASLNDTDSLHKIAGTENNTDNNNVNTNVAAISTPDDDEARNDAALEASKKVYASVDIPKIKSRIADAANFYFASGNTDITDEKNGGLRASANEEASVADRYYMMVTTEGKVVRMSKKLGHIACCISGEAKDTECVNKLKRWQEKLANLPGLHSTGNFSDLMELVCALEEN